MNPRRVAVTATALFGTVILVGGVIAAVTGFEMGEASVSNADAVSAATAVTAITEAALPDGSQRSAAETVPAQVAAVSASDLARTKEAVSSAGTVDELLLTLCRRSSMKHHRCRSRPLARLIWWIAAPRRQRAPQLSMNSCLNLPRRSCPKHHLTARNP